MTIRIVTRGDDAGMSKSANRALRESVEKGICRNISVMAIADHLQNAADCLADLKGINFGFHLALNAEWDVPRWGPVLPREKVPALLDEEGYLLKNPKLTNEADAPVEQMLSEAVAQLERIRKAGFNVSYIDEHMGVAWIKDLSVEITALARKEGLIFRPPLECLPHLEKDEYGGDHPGRLLAQMKTCSDGDYLVVGHPTYDDEEMRHVGRFDQDMGHVGEDRLQQGLMFRREDILEYVQQKGIQSIRYDQV